MMRAIDTPCDVVANQAASKPPDDFGDANVR